MITLSSSPPTSSGNEWLSFMTAWLDVVKDPDTFQQHLAQLAAEAQRLEQATAKERDVAAVKAETEAAIAKAQADHTAKLRADQAEHDRKCAAAWAEIQERDAESKKLADETRIANASAAKLKTDLDARIAIIRQAGL
jgi:hypothetical protein